MLHVYSYLINVKHTSSIYIRQFYHSSIFSNCKVYVIFVLNALYGSYCKFFFSVMKGSNYNFEATGFTYCAFGDSSCVKEYLKHLKEIDAKRRNCFSY